MMSDEDKKESSEDLAVKAGLLLVKKELEEKTGQYSPQSKEKKTMNQDEFLKKLRDKKKKTVELSVDVFTLKHSYNYTDDIDVTAVVEFAKDKVWDNPRDINLLNILGTAYMVMGEYSKAELEFKKGFNVDKGQIDLLYNSAELAIRKGSLRDGIEYLGQLLKKSKDDINALYLMSLVFFLKGNIPQTISVLAQPLKIDKEFVRVHKNFTVLSIFRKNIEKSKEILRKILEVSVKNVWGRVTLQSICLKEHKYEEYMSEQKILENILPEKETIYSPCINVNKGLFESLNEGTAAADYYKEALHLNGKCICALIEYGRHLIKEKKYSEANDIIKKGLYMAPGFKPILGIAVKLYYNLNLENEAEDAAVKLLAAEKGILIRIYNKEKNLYTIELEKLKGKTVRNLGAILQKFGAVGEVDFEIETDDEMAILKVYRDMRLCEGLCSVQREQ